MKNRFIELNNDNVVDIQIQENEILDIFDINESNIKTTLNIHVPKNIELYINMSSLNYDDYKKKFIVNVILEGDNSYVQVKSNCLGINKSSTEIEINGICDSPYQSKINIQIDGIIDSESATITGKPKFIFKSNTIEARHGLTIGKVNDKELSYLLSRGINSKSAKYMLISAKLFECLKRLPTEQIELKKQQILNIWGEENA